MERIAVIGAGSWGTALAQVEACAGHYVTLWDRNGQLLKDIFGSRQNLKYHAGRQLSLNIHPTSDIRGALQDAVLVIVAIPSNTFRAYLPKIVQYLEENTILVSAAKGIEVNTLKTLSSVAEEILKNHPVKKNYAVLSGPSFAREVIENSPTAVTVASKNEEIAKKVQTICHTETFQIFTTTDVIGVEVAGALKNVIAIAAGASDGFGFGLSTRAALITRGLTEISRIGEKMGANPLTFLGLSGLGDLILTCTSDLSRNRQVGLKLAQGKSLRVVLKEVGQTAEGIRTAKAAFKLAQSLHVEAPILEEIYLTLHKGKPPKQAIKDLLTRAPEDERKLGTRTH